LAEQISVEQDQSCDGGKFLVAIALGSNLGDRQTILTGAIACLQAHPAIEILTVSRWYETAPIGPPQPDYLNGCATLRTSLEPIALLDTLHQIEDKFGRIRQEVWGARTLDLDLLLYSDRAIDTPTLQIPHPRMVERSFVLVPLAEIAPNWIEPQSGHTIAELCHRFQDSISLE
jgi:2-amino-4-hydroxy-6-hydroxymethyldihydropteridine diphosphokinase